MKASILGVAKLLDSGDIAVPIRIGECVDYLTLPPEDLPPGGWEGVISCSEPHRLPVGRECYLYRGKVVQVTDATHLSQQEVKLEVAHAVLRHEKRYMQLQRELEAFNNLDRADMERLQRISEDVRLFVWQRDQGKCVKCGSNEHLEFDHIIPVAKGGSSTERNIQLLCERCNREKGTEL